MAPPPPRAITRHRWVGFRFRFLHLPALPAAATRRPPTGSHRPSSAILGDPEEGEGGTGNQMNGGGGNERLVQRKGAVEVTGG